MPKLRLNTAARDRLQDYARVQLGAVLPDPRVALRDAFGVFVHAEWSRNYPAADMAVLARYGMATSAESVQVRADFSIERAEEHQLGFTGQDLRLAFKHSACDVKLPTALWIPMGRGRLTVTRESGMVESPAQAALAQAALEFVFNMCRATAARRAALRDALAPYLVLLRESRMWEDVEAVWPEAASQRPSTAPQLPAKLTSAMLEQIERDRRAKAFEQPAPTTDAE